MIQYIDEASARDAALTQNGSFCEVYISDFSITFFPSRGYEQTEMLNIRALRDSESALW
jgi:hypothetical protein